MDELRQFLSRTGKTHFLVHRSIPTASYVASHLQQLTDNLNVKTVNRDFEKASKISPKLLYSAIPSSTTAKYVGFSDFLRPDLQCIRNLIADFHRATVVCDLLEYLQRIPVIFLIH